MSEEIKKQSHDKALGMDREISRRDFMNATLLASGSAALSGLTPYELLAQMGKDNWTGDGGVGDYAESHGNTFEVMTSGHQIRDHVFADPPHPAEETGEILDFVIVGGGLSGLGTALLLQATCAKSKMPHTRKPSYLRRRGKTERIHCRRPSVNCAAGL